MYKVSPLASFPECLLRNDDSFGVEKGAIKVK